MTRAIVQVGRANYSQAIATLLPLVTQDPGNAEVQYWLGRADYGDQLYRSAAAAFAQAIQRDGGNIDLCRWHARALRESCNPQEALAAYTQYHTQFPEDADFLAEYAEIQALTGRYSEARASFTRLAQLDPSPSTIDLVARWTTILGDLTSRAELEPPLVTHPYDFEVRGTTNDPILRTLPATIEQARSTVSATMGISLTGFRVVVFASRPAFMQYVSLSQTRDRETFSPAFSLPNLLVLLSPSAWAPPPKDADEVAGVLRHELTHIAIQRKTCGNAIPLWFNEGLACWVGGSGGPHTGLLLAKPYAPDELNAALVSSKQAEQVQAYAQAYAMATVIATKLGPKRITEVLDRVAQGIPFDTAIDAVSDVPFADILATWPQEYRKLGKSKD